MTSHAFLSDNAAGAHPEVIAALVEANPGHAPSYGPDRWTNEAKRLFARHFGDHAETLFVLTGTAANVIALNSVTASYEAVICADCAHLHRDECGALEKFLGCKLLLAQSDWGKLTPESIAPLLVDTDIVHRAQPKVVSITQCTEWGTVYTPDEIRTLADFCHAQGLFLHMDGARLANAAAALDLSLGALTTQVGVDLLSFGGTKNGLVAAEAVVLFRPELAKRAEFYRKQAMQLVSKMRFVAAQFLPLLSGDLWRRSALQANRMATLLAERVGSVEGVEIVAPVETNVVFAKIPEAWIETLRSHYAFAVWNTRAHIVRWMTAFDTSEEEIEAFAADLDGIARGR